MSHIKNSGILTSVFLELERQNTLKAQGKFKETAFDKMKKGDKPGAALVLIEELLEAAECVTRAVNDEKWDKLREELVQTAAVALSALDGLAEEVAKKPADESHESHEFAKWYTTWFPYYERGSFSALALRSTAWTAWNESAKRHGVTVTK